MEGLRISRPGLVQSSSAWYDIQTKDPAGASIVEFSRSYRSKTPEWWLKLELGSDLARRYGIGEAVPAILTRRSRVGDDLLRAFDRLAANSDASKDLAFLFSAGADASEQMARARRPIATHSIRTLRHLSLEQEIASVLRATDFFDFVLSIKDEVDFYGRKTLLDRVYRAVDTLDNNVGLFGLRKTGKSSVLRALEREFLTKGVAPAYFQLNMRQSLAPERLRQNLLSAVIDAVARTWTKWSMPADRETERIDLRRVITASREIDSIDFSELLGRFGELIRPHKCVVLLDESDFLLPRSLDRDVDHMGGIEPEPKQLDDVRRTQRNQIFSELRGCIEELDVPVRFVFAGVSSSLFSSAVVFGQENYLYQFGESVGIGAMSRAEADALVKGLGRRSGLKFAPECLSVLYDEYGGMPFLLRRAGSRIAKSSARQGRPNEVPFMVDRELVLAVLAQRDEESPWGQAVQLLISFDLYHPGASRDLLSWISNKDASLSSQVQMLAQRYGLLDPLTDQPIGVLSRIDPAAVSTH